mgnify:CR=1 FL=1
MKQLSLENFGVQELDAREMKETDGGLLAYLIGTALIAGSITVAVTAACLLVSEGFEAGYNATQGLLNN